MRLLCQLLATFAAVLLLAGSAGAAEWRVPSDFATIQDAIDSPSVKAGDAIVVDAGAYAGARRSRFAPRAARASWTVRS
jgi:hypothetical protein